MIRGKRKMPASYLKNTETLPESLGNKLMVARTMLSTRNIIAINNRILVLGRFISGHPLNESNQGVFNSAIN